MSLVLSMADRNAARLGIRLGFSSDSIAADIAAGSSAGYASDLDAIAAAVDALRIQS